MQKHEQLFQEFDQQLAGMIQELNQEAQAAKESGDQQGFINGQIQKNVVDIFQKMWKVAYNNVYVKPQIPDLVKIIEQHETKEAQFKAAYLSFFTKIPTPWRAKAEKDQKFGKIEEYEKEQTKLQLAEQIQSAFESTYNQIYGVD